MSKSSTPERQPFTIPFSTMDEAIMHTATVKHHSNVHVEVRASSSLDAERLRDAIFRAMAEHPLTRARQEAHKSSDRNFQWQITPEAGNDPLFVLEGGDEKTVSHLRDQILNMLPPLHESPALQVWLLRRNNGDTLIFNFNHTIGDGIGCLHVLRSVINNYAGIKTQQTVDPLEIRKAPGIHTNQQDTGKQQQENLLELLRRNLGKATHLAPDGGDYKSGYGCHLLQLSGREMKKLNPKKYVKATLNDLLLAAMHKSVELWNQDHQTQTRLVRVQTPVNLRPAHWQHEVLGNYIGSFPTISGEKERANASDLMLAIYEQTQTAKNNDIGALMYDALHFQTKLPIFAKERFMPGLVSASNSVSSFISNLGRFPAKLTFGDDQEASDVWFSPPPLMSAGIGLGVVGYQDSLFLGFRYARDQFDIAATQRFSELYRDTLHWLS